MKKFTLLLTFLVIFTFGAVAQVLTPVGWYNFDAPDFNDNPYEWNDTAKIMKMPASWDYDVATVDFDAMWDMIPGDAMQMTNHAKDGEDIFDGGTSAGSSWKAAYDENALYVMLLYVDKFAQITDHGWEIGIQTMADRYEPDFESAGEDVILRNKSYARFLELGGKKIRFLNGAIDECNGSVGTTAAWANVGVGLEALLLAEHYVDDGLAVDGNLKVILILDYPVVLAYLTDPATGDIETLTDYTAFDPVEKPVISFDVKSIGNVNATASHYWWNAHQDEAYITTYYCGHLEFTDEEIGGGGEGVENLRQPEVYAYVNQDILMFTGQETVSVNIYSITGQLVRYARNVSQVNISDLQKGIYFARIEGLQKAIKFVK